MDDMLDELQITAERVERFRAIHEDAVTDLRQKIADARAAGHDHDEIDSRIRDDVPPDDLIKGSDRDPTKRALALAEAE